MATAETTILGSKIKSDLPIGRSTNFWLFNPMAKMTSEADQRTLFESAVARLMDRLYGVALRFTKNPANAEDLLADTLIKAWKNIDSLDNFDSFDGWIMRILSNTYISQWRREKTAEGIFEADVDVDDLDDSQSLYARLHQPFLLWWGTPEQTFVNNLLVKDIEKAVDELPDAYRVVVIMVEVLGFTYEEVSSSIEVPVGTVRSRLNRGRRKLQDALWQNAKDAGLVANQDA